MQNMRQLIEDMRDCAGVESVLDEAKKKDFWWDDEGKYEKRANIKSLEGFFKDGKKFNEEGLAAFERWKKDGNKADKEKVEWMITRIKGVGDRLERYAKKVFK